MSDSARPVAPRRAYALAAGLLTAGASLYVGVVARLDSLDTGVSVAPVAIAIVTLLLSASAVMLQFRRQAHTLSLTEVPLAIGLFAVSPGALVLAKVAGHALDAVRHRVPAYKTAFNLSLVAVQAPVAVLVFRLVLHGDPAIGPRGWLAAAA